MVEDIDVQLLDFLRHDVRDDLLDGLCSQLVLDYAVVLDPVDNEVVAVLLTLVHVDDGVALPELLDVDDLVVLLELPYLDVLDLMLYDEVAVALSESLYALDELADVEGLVVGCRCLSLRSRCCRPTLLLTILDVLLDILRRDVDVGTILLRVPNLIADDDLDADPSVVLKISDVDPDLDVANVLVDANLEMAGSQVAHRCRFRSHH